MRQVLYVLLTRSPLSFLVQAQEKLRSFTCIRRRQLIRPEPGVKLSNKFVGLISSSKKFYSFFLKLSFFGINVDLIRLVFNVQNNGAGDENRTHNISWNEGFTINPHIIYLSVS